MIDTTNLEQAKSFIRTSKEKPLIVLAQNDDFNRKIIEYGKFDILLGIEAGKRERTLRNIDSGFNHVLAEIAKKNNVAIGIDLKKLSELSKEQKALMLERFIQNIRFCRKSKTKIALINYKDRKNALAFMTSLGASTQQARESIDF